MGLNHVPRLDLQVLVSTSTLAWGVNLPAHLVIIKGTEFFDAPSKRYVDFPITDVLQVLQISTSVGHRKECNCCKC